VAERTASLREEQERLRLAIEAGRFSTWEADLRAGTTTRAGRSLETLGLPADSPPSAFAEWHERIHPADRDAVRAAWDDVVAGRQPGYRIEYRFRRPDGAWRWIESTAAVVRHDAATGAPLRLAGTNRDITDRREEEERRDLLTREVNHRARNTLAIVQAILRLTRAEDAAGYARLIEGRIAALARAQSLLAAERWTGAPLGTLLTEELAPFGGTGEGAATRFVLGGPPLRLRAEAVQPLGMVMHELATNAAKHGALSVPGGRVEVSWQADEAAGLLRIRWAETGGPAPRFPQTRGVGSRVIEATAAGQLGGRVQRRWPESGLVCDLALPLATMRAGPA
jgi:PAS domain S-box-containing protein